MLSEQGAPGSLFPASFPHGDLLVGPEPFSSSVLRCIDDLLLSKRCEHGRLDLNSGSVRLSCLIHGGRPLVAGLADQHGLTPVPLADFIVRARQLDNAECTLHECDPALVLMTGVHFRKQPSLHGSVELVNPAHMLRVLAKRGDDAALSLERDGRRTLLFLFNGKPARLFFADPNDDPDEGSLEERFLLYSFGENAKAGSVEVFTSLKLPNDPDSGKTFGQLEEATQPPPPARLRVTLNGREIRERPFVPPHMLIGRDPRVDLFIDNAGISREHAKLAWERGEWVLTDLGSANGTRVDGEPVQRTSVSPLNLIEFGKYQLRIEEIESFPEAPQTMMVPTRKAVEQANAKYVLICDDERFELSSDLLIGKGDQVDIKIRGFFARSVHARLTREAKDHFLLRCMGGARAVVDSARVAQAEISPGDSVRIGSSTLVIERETTD